MHTTLDPILLDDTCEHGSMHDNMYDQLLWKCLRQGMILTSSNVIFTEKLRRFAILLLVGWLPPSAYLARRCDPG